MKVAYTEKKFHRATLKVIDQANEIMAGYIADDLSITLRQLYYRFVAKALIPNTTKAYKRLGTIVSDGRLAGLIDWDSIVDRTRNRIANSHWESPARILDSCVDSYAEDKWADQDYRVEVWIEKEALASVFEVVTQELDVTLFPCRGYVSQSEMWSAAVRLIEYAESSEQRPVILHFGDHDPSGIDMSRDIIDRMDVFGADLDFERIALNMDQVEQYGPPPNPAKITDSRFAAYLAEYGGESWELDALEPSVLRDLITEHVTAYRDDEKWEAAIEHEEAGRSRLRGVRDSWDSGAMTT